MAAYDFPQPSEMQRIADQKAPLIRARSVIWDFFEEESKDIDVLRWFQKDLYTGMQSWRGIGGKPAPVSLVGDQEYLAQPGSYGDFMPMDERFLMTYSRPESPDGPRVNLTEIVMELQDELLRREYLLKEFCLWKLLVEGTFTITKDNATVYSGSYTQQSFSAGTAWATVATATPMKDLLGLPILGRGKQVNFGRGARLLMNQKTANYLILNTNAADIGGKLLGNGNTFNTLNDVNNVLQLNGCPTVEICEEGFFDAANSNTWTPWIPDNKFVLIGTRQDARYLGSYRMTKNVNSPSGRGSYSKVMIEQDEVPIRAEVHQGHNGGPVLLYPGSIIKGNV